MSEPTDQLRFGILGTGRILTKLGPSLRMARGVKLHTIASRLPARAEEAAFTHEADRHHDSYEALIADPEVDVVLVALHNGLHCEWTCRALAAGKHVLCEKPLACSTAEVDQMFAAAREAQRWLMEGFMYRFHPQMNQVRQWLDERLLGRLLHIRAHYASLGREPDNPRYRLADGGGALMDLGCYTVHLARWLAGQEPARIQAWSHRATPTGVDLTTTAMLEFTDGPVAHLLCSFEAAGSYSAEIIGTSGKLTIPHPWLPPSWPAELILQRAGKTETVRIEPPSVPPHPLVSFVLEIEHFAECIRSNQPPAVIPETDSRANMQALESIRAATCTADPVGGKVTP